MKEEKEELRSADAAQPEVAAVNGPKGEPEEDPKLEAVDEPEPEGQTGGSGPEVEAVEQPATKAEKQAEPHADPRGESEDSLELDRMEVRPVAGVREEVTPEAKEVQPLLTEMSQPARPSLPALLHDHWILILGLLLGLFVVSAASLFLLSPRHAPRQATSQAPREEGMQVITASLGGEHYVRFNLWGPFRDPERQEALMRGLPKVKNDLILSGGDPEVARAIQENDLVFLERHILRVVSNATRIPEAEMDLKGLAVTRYSDEAELRGMR
jgi:hypothetical protein